MASATLSLARESQLVRARKTRKQAAGGEGAADQQGQPFTYAIVIDFESTCWQRGDADASPPEIIEFPAVLVDLRDGRLLAEFRQYVLPTERPRLSTFCTSLTGITEAALEEEGGVPLPTALLLFRRWVDARRRELGFVTADQHRPGVPVAAFVTWSDWDLNVCLPLECRRKQLGKPAFLDAWCDLRLLYTRFYGRRPRGLNGALQDVGVVFEGREHSGICDARNTARLVDKMVRRDGCRLVITKQSGSNRNGTAKNKLPQHFTDLSFLDSEGGRVKEANADTGPTAGDPSTPVPCIEEASAGPVKAATGAHFSSGKTY